MTSHITDAELTAMYGRGLHPDTAARVIDEVRRLKSILDAYEALIGRLDDEVDGLRESMYAACFRLTQGNPHLGQSRVFTEVAADLRAALEGGDDA